MVPLRRLVDDLLASMRGMADIAVSWPPDRCLSLTLGGRRCRRESVGGLVVGDLDVKVEERDQRRG